MENSNTRWKKCPLCGGVGTFIKRLAFRIETDMEDHPIHVFRQSDIVCKSCGWGRGYLGGESYSPTASSGKDMVPSYNCQGENSGK